MAICDEAPSIYHFLSVFALSNNLATFALRFDVPSKTQASCVIKVLQAATALLNFCTNQIEEMHSYNHT